MKIAVSGTACQGKTTFISDFLKEWPMYTTPSISYRDIIKNKNLPHSKNTNKQTQKAILEALVQQLDSISTSDNIIYDRCVMDNLVYTFWALAKNSSDITGNFIDECIPIVREAMGKYDIILFTPLTKHSPKIVKDELREIDEEYINEIDNLFKMMYEEEYKKSKSIYYNENRPAIIEIFGTREQRIEICKLYLDKDGNAIEPGNIITEQELQEMEKIKKVFTKEVVDLNKKNKPSQ
jgi:hypothetical protein